MTHLDLDALPQGPAPAADAAVRALLEERLGPEMLASLRSGASGDPSAAPASGDPAGESSADAAAEEAEKELPPPPPKEVLIARAEQLGMAVGGGAGMGGGGAGLLLGSQGKARAPSLP